MHVIIGNHETDRRTPEHLIAAVKESKFDWLGDNYRFNTGGSGGGWDAPKRIYIHVWQQNDRGFLADRTCGP